MLVQIVTGIAAVAAAFGTGFYLACALGALRFSRMRRAVPGFSPAVSILKPLRGDDRELYDCLRSHCVQDYPDYEIVFGVDDAGDPAVPVVERLIREFPERRLRLVICPERLGANRKVSNLIQMLPSARHTYLLVNDSDILVPPDYLRRVMANFADPQVGLVTALYRGVPGTTLWSKLEAFSIVDFMAAVFGSTRPKNFPYGFGCTLAFLREALEGIGGFEAIADYVADDYHLATRIRHAGYRLVLSDVVVETPIPEYSAGDFYRHQARWARTVRDANPAGFAGMPLAFGVGWAVVAVVISGGAAWSWWLLLAAALARVFATWVVARTVLHDRSVTRLLPILPARELAAVFFWFAAYTGSGVEWRGERYTLKEGKLLPQR